MVIAGRFSVARVASAGGMGRIYEAIDLHTGLPVAVKLMHESAVETRESARFAREAETLADLKHPGIVRYIAHGLAENGERYLAMEWLQGVDLHRFLEGGALSVPEVMLLARQVAEALAMAHQRGIVHRDLKPSNLFLVGGNLGQLKLIDFGVARPALRGQALTQTGAVVGTPTYMAPEQARGERAIGPAADIFSLGCILYECLTGNPPFVANHMAAVLAKILFEEAPPIWNVRPLVPDDLGDLVMRMLSKSPAGRPSDAAALAVELARIAAPDDPDAPAVRPRREPARAITGREQYLVSVVVARVPDQASAVLPTVDIGPALVKVREDSLRLQLAQYGVQVEGLADGSIVATSKQPGNATDQARQAARCALLIRERIPDAIVSLATGRGHLGPLGYVPVGEAIDRAVHLLHSVPVTLSERQPQASSRLTEGVLTDELTAALLENRFVITRTGEHQILGGERLTVDDTRLLLGNPTPCVGREHELALLEMNLTQCVDEAYAYAVLVVAPPGMGKSRLGHEFIRRVEAKLQGQRLLVLFGRGDPATAGSPYGLLAQAIRRMCEAQHGDALASLQDKLRERIGRHVALEDTQRVVEFVGEMCGVPFPDESSPQLRAARQDPKVMSDQVAVALVELFRAECAQRLVLLVLEDLHWSDGLTIKLIEGLLREVGNRPFLVLAFARPEVYETFPSLFSVRASVLTLRGLGTKASERLIRQVLGETVDAETVARIVRQAAGNALFLEELIRAVAEGHGEGLPETVLAILQSRMSRLDAGTRRLLRAGSVFGAEFWQSGAVELCGGTKGEGEVEDCLRIAVEQEFIERSKESRFPSEIQYAFRHALMRDAAYSLLTEQDRQTGHRLAAPYLEKLSEPDPAVLADHFQKGGEPARAVPYFIRAAELAAAGNDLPGTLRRVERGLACGPHGEELGSLRGLQCSVGFWNDRWESAYPTGSEAMELLPVGSYRWCKTMGSMLTITSLSGKLDHFGKLVSAFAATEPAGDARTAYVEAASMLVTMFSYLARRPQALKFQERMERIGALVGPDDATTQGWIKQGQVYYARSLEPDPWRTLRIAEEGSRAFELAGSTRNHIILSNFLGLAQAELGAVGLGEVTLRAALSAAQRLKETLALSRSMMCLAYLLTMDESPAKHDEAFALASETVATRGVNSVYLGTAHDVLAEVHLARGALEPAEREARRSIEVLAALPVLRLRAAATLIRALLAHGKTTEARAVAEAGLASAGELGGIGFAEVTLRLAVAEARRATGDAVGASAALAEARRHIDERADRIADAEWQKRYLELVPENVRVRAFSP